MLWKLFMGTKLRNTESGWTQEFAATGWSRWAPITVAVECVLVTQSYPTLFDPMDCSPPGSSVYGILQARILEWVALLLKAKPNLHCSNYHLNPFLVNSPESSRCFVTLLKSQEMVWVPQLPLVCRCKLNVFPGHMHRFRRLINCFRK